MAKIKIKKFYKGNILIKEGVDNEFAYIINSGMVEVYKEITKYDIRVLTQLGPGQILGEMSLFGNKKPSASVRALTDLEVQVIDKQVFEDFLEQTPPLIKILLEILSVRLAATSEKYILATNIQSTVETTRSAPKIDKIDIESGKLQKKEQQF